MHTLARDLKIAEAQAGQEQKPTKTLTHRSRLSRQGPPVQQVSAVCPSQGLAPNTLFHQKPFPGNRINFTLHLGISQGQVTSQAIWDGIWLVGRSDSWALRLIMAVVGIPEHGAPPPRHSCAPDFIQHPF